MSSTNEASDPKFIFEDRGVITIDNGAKNNTQEDLYANFDIKLDNGAALPCLFLLQKGIGGTLITNLEDFKKTFDDFCGLTEKFKELSTFFQSEDFSLKSERSILLNNVLTYEKIDNNKKMVFNIGQLMLTVQEDNSEGLFPNKVEIHINLRDNIETTLRTLKDDILKFELRDKSILSSILNPAMPRQTEDEIFSFLQSRPDTIKDVTRIPLGERGIHYVLTGHYWISIDFTNASVTFDIALDNQEYRLDTKPLVNLKQFKIDFEEAEKTQRTDKMFTFLKEKNFVTGSDKSIESSKTTYENKQYGVIVEFSSQNNIVITYNKTKNMFDCNFLDNSASKDLESFKNQINTIMHDIDKQKVYEEKKPVEDAKKVEAKKEEESNWIALQAQKKVDTHSIQQANIKKKVTDLQAIPKQQEGAETDIEKEQEEQEENKYKALEDLITFYTSEKSFTKITSTDNNLEIFNNGSSKILIDQNNLTIELFHTDRKVGSFFSTSLTENFNKEIADVKEIIKIRADFLEFLNKNFTSKLVDDKLDPKNGQFKIYDNSKDKIYFHDKGGIDTENSLFCVGPPQIPFYKTNITGFKEEIEYFKKFIESKSTLKTPEERKEEIIRFLLKEKKFQKEMRQSNEGEQDVYVYKYDCKDKQGKSQINVSFTNENQIEFKLVGSDHWSIGTFKFPSVEFDNFENILDEKMKSLDKAKKLTDFLLALPEYKFYFKSGKEMRSDVLNLEITFNNLHTYNYKYTLGNYKQEFIEIYTKDYHHTTKIDFDEFNTEDLNKTVLEKIKITEEKSIAEKSDLNKTVLENIKITEEKSLEDKEKIREEIISYLSNIEGNKFIKTFVRNVKFIYQNPALDIDITTDLEYSIFILHNHTGTYYNLDRDGFTKIKNFVEGRIKDSVSLKKPIDNLLPNIAENKAQQDQVCDNHIKNYRLKYVVPAVCAALTIASLAAIQLSMQLTLEAQLGIGIGGSLVGLAFVLGSYFCLDKMETKKADDITGPSKA